MATVLDFSILSSLSIIFIFITIFIGAWAMLTAVDWFKLGSSNKKIYAVLAFALAFIVILSRPALSIFAFSIPWFAVLLLVAFFMIFMGQVISPGWSTAKLVKEPVVYGFLIFFVAIIMMMGLANSFGQDLLEEQPGFTDVDTITGAQGPVDPFVPAGEFENDPALGELDTSAPTVRRPAQDDLGSNIVLTLFHPKILGMLFMMLLATVTILLIAR